MKKLKLSELTPLPRTTQWINQIPDSQLQGLSRSEAYALSAKPQEKRRKSSYLQNGALFTNKI